MSPPGGKLVPLPSIRGPPVPSSKVHQCTRSTRVQKQGPPVPSKVKDKTSLHGRKCQVYGVLNTGYISTKKDIPDKKTSKTDDIRRSATANVNAYF